MAFALTGEVSLGNLMKIYGGVNLTSSDKNSDYGPMPSIAPFLELLHFQVNTESGVIS